MIEMFQNLTDNELSRLLVRLYSGYVRSAIINREDTGMTNELLDSYRDSYDEEFRRVDV